MKSLPDDIDTSSNTVNDQESTPRKCKSRLQCNQWTICLLIAFSYLMFLAIALAGVIACTYTKVQDKQVNSELSLQASGDVHIL